MVNIREILESANTTGAPVSADTEAVIARFEMERQALA